MHGSKYALGWATESIDTYMYKYGRPNLVGGKTDDITLRSWKNKNMG